MKIWFISDTHNHHEELTIPQDIDCVIFCGDESNHFDPSYNWHEAFNFFAWFDSIDIMHKVYIPGNHSTAVYQGMIRPNEWTGIDFLIHRSTVIEGLSIFGSPHSPTWGKSGAYMVDRRLLDYYWDSIPSCDILITHCPPKGILDLTHDKDDETTLVQAGCEYLYNHVNRIKPKVHAFGHIHESPGCYNFGVFEKNETKFVNCGCFLHRMNKLENGIILDVEPNNV